MDRQVSQQQLAKEARFNIMKWVFVLSVIAMLIVAAQFVLTPSIARADIRISTVTRGNIDATISASGRLIPIEEGVITAEVSSRVEAVHLKVGAHVEPGDLILTLSSEQIDVRITQVEQQILLKDNQLITMKLQHQANLRKNNSRRELLNIEKQGLEVKLAKFQHLFKQNIVSEFDLQEADLNLKRASTELTQQDIELQALVETYLNQVKSVELERDILQTDLKELRNQKRRTQIRATRNGVLASVLDQVGTSVPLGKELCKISDLSAFKVEVTTSDFYAERLSRGQVAQITVGQKQLTGRLERLLPAVESGRLTMWIDLEQPNHPDLHANQRVEVQVITDSKRDALMVENGDFLNGAGLQDVFVIKGDNALKTQIEVGLKNKKQVEITYGVREGEQVIISKLDDKMHLEKFQIK